MAKKPGKPLVWLKGEVDAVVILDVFSKKTEATPTGVFDTRRKRLAIYLKVISPKERQ